MADIAGQGRSGLHRSAAYSHTDAATNSSPLSLCHLYNVIQCHSLSFSVFFLTNFDTSAVLRSSSKLSIASLVFSVIFDYLAATEILFLYCGHLSCIVHHTTSPSMQELASY